MSNIIIDDDNKNSEVNINDEVQKDFLNNIIQDDNIIDIILRQIENDNELSNIDYLEDLLERVDDYREKYKDDLDLINISKVKEQEIYIQILSKLLVEKYKFPEDVLEQYDIPSTLKNLLVYSYKTLVLKRKELIVNFLENIMINNMDDVVGSVLDFSESEDAKSYISKLFKQKKISERLQGCLLYDLNGCVKYTLNVYLDNLDDNYNPLDYIIYGKEDEYEYNFIANYLGDYIGYSFIRDFCNPILLDNETSEILESSLYINLCERFTNGNA